jgi:hypothetical protein
VLKLCDEIQAMLDAIQQAENESGIGLGLFGGTDTAQTNLDTIRGQVQALLDDVQSDIDDVLGPVS